MNTQPLNLHHLVRRSLAAGTFLLAGALALAADGPMTKDYHPDNTFSQAPVLPVRLKRIAVLPLMSDSERQDLTDGREVLKPVLFEELVKTKKFEVVKVTPELLRHQTGRAGWTGTEALPANFFDTLQKDYACDAVLLAELTSYRAYAPLCVGWRLKLVDVRTHKIIWAADEVFDASHAAVANGARHSQPSRLLLFGTDPTEAWLVANSPSRFGGYSIATLLKTLPDR